MSKTPPLCTTAKSNLGDREKLYCFSRQRETVWANALKMLCSNLGEFDEELYSNGSRDRIADKG